MPSPKMTALALTAAIASGVPLSCGGGGMCRGGGQMDQTVLEPCVATPSDSVADGSPPWHFTVKSVPMAYFDTLAECNSHRSADCGNDPWRYRCAD